MFVILLHNNQLHTVNLIKFFAGEMTTANPAMFAKTNIETIKTQYIAKITSQIPPAADELTYAFNRRFGSYEGMSAKESFAAFLVNT